MAMLVCRPSALQTMLLAGSMVLAGSRRVPRPDLDFGDNAVVLTHDARLDAGESREYMVTPAMGASRCEHPAIHVCWDNRSWTCEQYWLVPASQSWSELMRTPG
jgi:hypothetical protein